MARVRDSSGAKVRPFEAAGKGKGIKLKLTLSVETVHRLRLEAFGRGCPIGLVVDELVAAAPRRFVLQDRARGAQGAEVQGSPAAEGVPAPQGAVRALGVVSREECA